MRPIPQGVQLTASCLPMQYLNRLRVEKAAELLLNSLLTNDVSFRTITAFKDGIAAVSGDASDINFGVLRGDINGSVDVVVTAEDGTTQMTYTVNYSFSFAPL